MALVECIGCGQQISDRAEQCPKCGHVAQAKCPNCGASASVSATACDQCGISFDVCPECGVQRSVAALVCSGCGFPRHDGLRFDGLYIESYSDDRARGILGMSKGWNRIVYRFSPDGRYIKAVLTFQGERSDVDSPSEGLKNGRDGTARNFLVFTDTTSLELDISDGALRINGKRFEFREKELIAAIHFDED